MEEPDGIDTPQESALWAEQPFLKGLTPDQLVAIAECAHPSDLCGGDYLFREGDPANHFYIITSARCRWNCMCRAMEPFIQTVSEHEVLGWSGCSRPTAGISMAAP